MAAGFLGGPFAQKAAPVGQGAPEIADEYKASVNGRTDRRRRWRDAIAKGLEKAKLTRPLSLTPCFYTTREKVSFTKKKYVKIFKLSLKYCDLTCNM